MIKALLDMPYSLSALLMLFIIEYPFTGMCLFFTDMICSEEGGFFKRNMLLHLYKLKPYHFQA
jgi:hypothetical protein